MATQAELRAERRAALGPAVFSRNHDDYLREAAEIAYRKPDRLITFRSHVPWRTAHRFVEAFGSIPIYFGVIDGPRMVQYTAQLKEVLLNPRKRTAAAKRLHRSTLRSTRDEDWPDGKGTAYAIASCKRVKAFSQTKLVKRNDGTHISSDYRRGYVIVDALESAPLDRGVVACDVAEPPARVEWRTYRFVRDTNAVRWLKKLHQNQCQICGTCVPSRDGLGYSEGHHLCPLGGDHRGVDVLENIIIVCPNCHAKCDLGVTRLSSRKLRKHPDHRIAAKYIQYHNHKVCG